MLGYMYVERGNVTQSAVKLFSKNSNLYDHDTSTSHPDRRTDRRRQLALALVGTYARGTAFSWVNCQHAQNGGVLRATRRIF